MLHRALRNAVAGSLAILSLVSPAVFADHKPVPEVVVTGRRDRDTLADIEQARSELDRTAGGANIVDGETYRTGRVGTLQDVLGLSPGVFVQPRFGSDEARLSIRGSGLQRTFHLRGINILQDGVPLNLADGGGDFQGVEGLSTRYVEVYRGANALVYGSTTLGGALNFVSPGAGDTPPLEFRTELGSFDYRRLQGAIAESSGNWDGFLSVAHTAQEGFRDQSEQNNERLSGHIGFAVTDRLSTRFFAFYTDSDSELPGNVTKAQLETDPEQANAANVAGDYQRDFELFRLSNKTSLDLTVHQRMEFLAYYSHKDLFHPIFQVIDQDSDDIGAGMRYINEAPWFGRDTTLTLGSNIRTGEADDDRFVNVAGQPGARTADRRNDAANYDVYGEVQHFVTPSVALVGGLQWTRAERQLIDHLGTADFDETYTALSPKLGARYLLTDKIQFFGNWSRSFEPPSFGELSGGQLVTIVKDQTAGTWELGTRGQLIGDSADWTLDWDAALYRADVKDELLSLQDAEGNPLGTVSADATIHQGLELGTDLRAGPIAFRQSYLWNDFTFDDDPAFGDNDLAGVPEHYYRAELTWNFGQGYYVGPVLEWVPKDYYVDHANTLEADGYAILGIKGGYRTASGFSFFIEGRNVTDEKYAATTGVIADANGADSAQFLPGDGAAIYAGFEWRADAED